MGAADDPRGLVGPGPKLGGMRGLRIAGNSIMPFVSNDNNRARAIMIGEIAADLLRKAEQEEVSER